MGVMLHLLSFLAVHHTLTKNRELHKVLLVKGFREKAVLLYVAILLTSY